MEYKKFCIEDRYFRRTDELLGEGSVGRVFGVFRGREGFAWL